MKRAKAERWEETSRSEVGVVTGQSRDAGAYFAIVYMVDECQKERGKAVKWRQRLLHGTTLYQAKNGFIGTSALLEVVATGVRALSAIARNGDDLATSRRKAR